MLLRALFISLLYGEKDWEYFLQYAHVAMQNHEARASRLRIYHLQGVPKNMRIYKQIKSNIVNAAWICKPNLLARISLVTVNSEHYK